MTNQEEIVKLTEVVIIALACPLLLPLVIEQEETELKGENNAE